MKKQIFSCLITGALLFSTVSAAVVELPVGKNTLYRFENSTLTEETLDAPAYINEASRTMVPVRAIAQAFDAAVEWLPESRSVIIKKGETEIKLLVDSGEAFVNAAPVTLDSPAVIRADRTMVPLRFIGEALGTVVSYSNGSVLLDDTKVLLKCGDKVFTHAQLDTLRDLYYTWNIGEIGEMDEKTFRESCVHTAILRADAILKIENAFPEAVIPADVYPSVIRESEALGKLTDMPLSGMRNLLYERLYFSGGVPLYDTLRASGTDYAARYEAEYVSAKHVLCPDEETAATVYEKAKAGADFDALIAEYGTDPGMVQNPDGYVFTKGEMVLPFETATFAAAIGEITSPVKSDYGYHVIQRLPLPPLTDDFINTIIYGDIQKRLNNSAATEYLSSYEEIMAMFSEGE